MIYDQYDKAKYYFEKTLSLIEYNNFDNTLMYCFALNELGRVLFEKNDPEYYPQVLEYLNYSVRLNEGRYPFILANSYNNLGDYNTKIDFHIADNYLKDALELIESNNSSKFYEKDMLRQTYNLLGNLYIFYNREDALQYYQKARNACYESFNQKGGALSHQIYLIGRYYRIMEQDYHKALDYYQEALLAILPDFNDTNVFVTPDYKNTFAESILIYILYDKARTMYFISINETDPEISFKYLYESYNIYKDIILLSDIHKKSMMFKHDKLHYSEYWSKYYYKYILLAINDLYRKTWDDQYMYDAFFYSNKSKISVLQSLLDDVLAKQLTNIPDSLQELVKVLDEKAEFYNMLANTSGSRNDENDSLSMSMARGFLFAGSRSLVLTLWSVADKSSSRLMQHFYKHLASNNNSNDALHLAKLEYLETADPMMTHLYYWAGYIKLGKKTLMVKPVSAWRISGIILIAVFMVGLWLVIRKKSKIRFMKA